MVLGVLAYGYIVASVAASLANADSARAQYQEKLKAVKSYMAVREMCHASVCVCAYVTCWEKTRHIPILWKSR